MRRITIALPAALLTAAAAATIAIGTAGGSGARSAAVGQPLFASLKGSKEISPTGQRNAGDRNGKGSFSATVSGNRLCFGIQVASIGRPTAAPIHRGRAGVNGAIVVPLRAPTAGSPGTSAGCVVVSATLLREIQTTPSGFYANVHTTDFSGGAVRGQLFNPTSGQDR
jgi:CHRD domain